MRRWLATCGLGWGQEGLEMEESGPREVPSCLEVPSSTLTIGSEAQVSMIPTVQEPAVGESRYRRMKGENMHRIETPMQRDWNKEMDERLGNKERERKTNVSIHKMNKN
ncbi:hypothetical protein TWF281_009357 [Arthrobotrys megalospora]